MAQQSPRLIATIIWAALLAGATMFLGVALFLVFGLRGGAGVAAPLDAEPALIGVSLALSAITVSLSWLWAVRMTGRAQSGVALRGGAIPPGP
jgi:membrane protein implicated in regulation of membrane protease activity